MTAKVFAACSVTPTDRAMRALAAVVLAAFSASMWSTNLLCAVPAATCSFFLVVGAVTGWCPTQLLRRVAQHGDAPVPTALGFPEALQDLDLDGDRERISR